MEWQRSLLPWLDDVADQLPEVILLPFFPSMNCYLEEPVRLILMGGPRHGSVFLDLQFTRGHDTLMAQQVDQHKRGYSINNDDTYRGDLSCG